MVRFKTIKWSCFLVSALLAVALLSLCGCSESQTSGEQKPVLSASDVTIGDLAEFHQFGAIGVTGFGIVASLPGTGSSECPPDLREKLAKYIIQQTPGPSAVDPHEFINSKDTAVVQVYGVIPSIASKGDRFDVKVGALSSTQTTSLDGGRLFTTELAVTPRFVDFKRYAQTLAKAHGPIFIDKLSGSGLDNNIGHILGGGEVAVDVRISLFLRKADFITANAIRNRLNERFGHGMANAVSAGEIQVEIPERYYYQKEKFLSMVKMTYLTTTSQLQEERITALVDKLAGGGKESFASEISLNAIGKSALDNIAPLLKSNNEDVRFRAARCMLGIGDNRSLTPLRQTATNSRSPYRFDAIKTIALNAERNDAITILTPLLDETDFEVRLAAYEQLRRLGDISVSQRVVGGDFYVDRVSSHGPKAVFVSRADVGRIVLFGAPIYCEKDIFIQSADGEITINGRADEEFVNIIRKNPREPGPIGQAKTTRQLTNIIQTLCGRPEGTSQTALGAGYAELIALLKQMTDAGALKVEFKVGPMPEIGLIMKKTGPKADNNDSAKCKIVGSRQVGTAVL